MNIFKIITGISSAIAIGITLQYVPDFIYTDLGRYITYFSAAVMITLSLYHKKEEK